MSGCGSEACGCGAANTSAANMRTGGQLTRFCPKCGSQAHPVSIEVPGNILKPEVLQGYIGETPNLCLNPGCEVSYFDPNTNEVFTNDDCVTGIWFKEQAQNSYICYCEKITEKEIIETVVETGLEDLGSVMLYLREGISEECEEKQPASISCNRYFQDAIEKARIIREALLEYQGLKPDSKEVPHQLIEERYNHYLMARNGSMATAGAGCCGGGCGCS